MRRPRKRKIPAISETELHVFQERDRLVIELRHSETEQTLIEWIDNEAYEAIEDGFIDTSEAIFGNIDRHVRQLGAMHRSIYEYWRHAEHGEAE